MESMKVVLADVEEKALYNTQDYFEFKGGDVLAILIDISRPEQVEKRADLKIETYGGVHLLCNHAGVGRGRLVRSTTLADWELVIGVNLWSVIYGVQIFLPIMLKQNTACHIMNAASVEGLVSNKWSSLISKQTRCRGFIRGFEIRDGI